MTASTSETLPPWVSKRAVLKGYVDPANLTEPKPLNIGLPRFANETGIDLDTLRDAVRRSGLRPVEGACAAPRSAYRLSDLLHMVLNMAVQRHV